MADPNQELLAHLHAMFTKADEEGLYLGMGYEPRLPRNKQEGPMIKRLRKLMREADAYGVTVVRHQSLEQGGTDDE